VCAAGNHGYRTMPRRQTTGARGGGVTPPVASTPEGFNPQGGEQVLEQEQYSSWVMLLG
jgi:hypothetical protein